MKRSYIITAAAIIMCTFFAACDKNGFSLTERDNPSGKAFIKIGFFPAYLNPLPTRVALNGTTVSNELLAPISYPGGGLNMNGSLNSDYLAVNGGNTQADFFVMNPGISTPAYKLFSISQAMEANKRYTLFITDTSNNMSAVLVNDDTNTPDSGNVRIKFVNIMPNVPSLDLYKGANAGAATVLMNNILYKGSSEYINVSAGTDSFFIRPAGAAATTLPVARRGFTLSNQRIYTILARGYNNGTANRAANVSAIVNQ